MLEGGVLYDHAQLAEAVHRRRCVRVRRFAFAAMTPPAFEQPSTTTRVAGISCSIARSEGIERPFFAGLAKKTGLNLTTNFNPMDVVNVKPEDALRLLRSGMFDVMSAQIGQASRDDPFFEGIDLAGGAICTRTRSATSPPPVGMNLYVVQGLRKQGSIRDVIVGVVPFLFMMLLMVLLIWFCPGLALWLPGQVMG
jgi:hypothetical protein